MAELRTIGAFMEDSGIDMCWIEADIYGPATVKQILQGNHVKRGETAHIVRLQALSDLYLKALLRSSKMNPKRLEDVSRQVADACKKESNEELKRANVELVTTVESEILEEMEKFDAEREKNPIFSVTRQYMKMVMEKLQFIRAVRTAD